MEVRGRESTLHMGQFQGLETEQSRVLIQHFAFQCWTSPTGGGGGSLVLFLSIFFLMLLPMVLTIPLFPLTPSRLFKIRRGKRNREGEPGTGLKLSWQLSSPYATGSSITSKCPSQMVTATDNCASFPFHCGTLSWIFVFDFASVLYKGFHFPHPHPQVHMKFFNIGSPCLQSPQIK